MELVGGRGQLARSQEWSFAFLKMRVGNVQRAGS